MIERIFVGWTRPTLPETARILQARYAGGAAWDMGSVYAVLPGAQAGRRLTRLLYDAATAAGYGTVTLPETLTPAALLDRCCAPDRRGATATEAHFAWVAAAQALGEDDRRRLAPKNTAADGPMAWAAADGPMAWADVAAQVRDVRAVVAAEGLTLADVAARCRADGLRADARWEALARLERMYGDQLAAAGLADRDNARLAALASGRVACDRDVYLIGAQDLNGLERATFRALPSRVVAVIPAPPEECDGFDDVGSLHAAAWQDRDVPIPDGRLWFVGGPADEAHCVADRIAALNGRCAPEEITVGVGDEAAADGLGLRLAALGLPSFSPFGRPVGRTGPAALLVAVRASLGDSSARCFAALVRHPALERWLEARLSATNDAAPSLLSSLDRVRAECLPESQEDLSSLLRSVSPKGEIKNEGVTWPLRIFPLGKTLRSKERGPLEAALNLVESLLAPLKGGKRPLSGWAEPIADVLRAVYADESVDDDTAEGRQVRRGLERLASALAGVKRLPPALAPDVSGRVALDFVLAQLEGQRLPSDDAGPGLEMMGWLELALDDAPVLLLTGLHEGCVPQNTGDDPLLPDSLRARLGLADSRRRLARDAFLLRVLRESRAEMHIVVARRGSDGDPKMPSRLLFACDAPTAAARARRFAQGDAAAGPTRPLFAPGGARSLAPPPPPPDGLHALRVTGFGDYLTCPYRFYLRHVLGLEALDDAQDEMDARLFGILIHDCLDGFAHSRASDSADADRVRQALREELRRQCARRFGEAMPRHLELQARQAGRRLDAFADWQAQSVRDGWRIEPDLAEQDMTALFVVDDQDFVITGRPDRVDYCPERGFRIIDYKTGDGGKGPDERHRTRTGVEIRWTDLQLPLYRYLMAAQGKPVAPGELGYVLLSADLDSVSLDARGRRRGGTGFVAVPWSEDDHADALRCAHDVVRALRSGVFWPPADPPPFAPSRADLGRIDPYSGICLDSCSDRADWLGLRRTTGERPPTA